MLGAPSGDDGGDSFNFADTSCVRCGNPAWSAGEHWPHCSAQCAKADLVARARAARAQAGELRAWRRELAGQIEKTLRDR